MYPLPNKKRFKRKTRLEQATSTIEGLTKRLEVSTFGLAHYADPKNWKATQETKDVVENGIVVGADVIKAWYGPMSGEELAGTVLKRMFGK